ncbi:MAG: hypothetical protein OXF02_01090 [Simkaniaceae bacterium]|nr:hypothetical protein [Simkaniaceae bacterium]
MPTAATSQGHLFGRGDVRGVSPPKTTEESSVPMKAVTIADETRGMFTDATGSDPVSGKGRMREYHIRTSGFTKGFVASVVAGALLGGATGCIVGAVSWIFAPITIVAGIIVGGITGGALAYKNASRRRASPHL